MGELGQGAGTTDEVAAPVEIDMSAHAENNDFTDISAGDRHFCAVHNGGKIFCCLTV